jgi:hypothetical protein
MFSVVAVVDTPLRKAVEPADPVWMGAAFRQTLFQAGDAVGKYGRPGRGPVVAESVVLVQ